MAALPHIPGSTYQLISRLYLTELLGKALPVTKYELLGAVQQDSVSDDCSGSKRAKDQRGQPRLAGMTT